MTYTYIYCLLQNVDQSGRVIGGNAQRVHALGDVVLDDADLTIGRAIVGTVVVELEAQLGSSLLKAGDSRLEVGVTGLLVDDADVDGVAFRERGGQRQHEQRDQDQGKDLLHGYTLLIIFCPEGQNRIELSVTTRPWRPPRGACARALRRAPC